MTPDLMARSCAALESITHDLTQYVARAAEDRSRFGIDLGEGWAGVALFLAEVSSGVDPQRAAARELLQLAAEHLENHPAPAGFFGGVAGVGWVMEHLRRESDLPPFLDLEELDGRFESSMAAPKRSPELDMESGLAGVALYLLERPRTASVEGALRLLGDSLSGHLAQHLVSDEINRDLGVAHGVPGMLAILARLHIRDPTNAKLRGAIEHGIRYLQTMEDLEFGVACDDRARLQSSPRIAWCYGDLGIACALLASSDVAPIAGMGEMGRRCAERVVERDARSALLRESGLCHGAAGGVTLLQALGHQTRDPRFAERACDYLSLLLEMQGRVGYGGFDAPLVAVPRNFGSHVPTPGFLRGSAGIGLALHSALGHQRPAWHRVLLASN